MTHVVKQLDISDPERIKVRHQNEESVLVRHMLFDRFTENGVKHFKNIFRILKNPDIDARTSTASAFLILF